MIRNVASAISLQRHHEPRRIRRYAGEARYHSPVELRGEQQLARRFGKLRDCLQQEEFVALLLDQIAALALRDAT